MGFFQTGAEPMRYRFHIWVGDRYISSGPAEWAGDQHSLMRLVEQLDPDGSFEDFHVHVTDASGFFVRSYLAQELSGSAPLQQVG